ncbi:MAG: hypothetical protein AB7L66_00540 [Gemmatimonadales bacterium]
MTQPTLLKWLVAILVALNLVMLGVVYGRLPRRSEPAGAAVPLRDAIVERLGFDESQRTAFAGLRSDHQHLMDSLTQARNRLLRDYFALLKDDQADSAERTVARERILGIEDARIEATYRHFERVRALARPDQLARFPEIVDAALGVLIGPRPPGGGPPRGMGPDRRPPDPGRRDRPPGPRPEGPPR